MSDFDDRSIVIRTARAGDESAVRQCAEQAYAKYVARIGKPPAPMIADFGAAIEAGHVHVAETGRRMAGYLTAFALDGDWHIDSVAVLPQFQGRSIGGRLIAHAEKLGRKSGHSRVTLYTNAKMIENIGYYPQLGYTETGRRSEAGYDRVFFAKPL